jgi:hypothetical protein
MMPLASKFWLSAKKGKKVWAEPIVDRRAKTVHFEINMGEPNKTLAKSIGSGTGFINDRGKKVKATFRCIICEVGMAKGDYINTEANKWRMGIMPLAIVAEGKRDRVYLPFDNEQREIGLISHVISYQSQRFATNYPFPPLAGPLRATLRGICMALRPLLIISPPPACRFNPFQ